MLQTGAVALALPWRHPCLYFISLNSNFSLCLADARFAHPLGMQSGLIKTNQMTYAGEKQSNASLARLFGPYGWRPGDAYLNTLSLIIASLNVKGLLAAKVYFQVDFGRMKKIDYFIIQDSKISSTTYTQTFFMLANVSEMRYYGLTGGVKPFNGNPQVNVKS